jgi:hypothetical protein
MAPCSIPNTPQNAWTHTRHTRCFTFTHPSSWSPSIRGCPQVQHLGSQSLSHQVEAVSFVSIDYHWTIITNKTNCLHNGTMFDSLHMSECLNIHNTQTTHNNTHDDSPIPWVNPLLSGGVHKSSTWALNLSIVERQLVLIVDNTTVPSTINGRPGFLLLQLVVLYTFPKEWCCDHSLYTGMS